MNNINLFKFEIYVDGKLRFIKNTIREKNLIVNSLIKNGIDNVSVNEIKLY